ncbi:MAG: methyltransferase [Candidatus Jorgensenbacteria bacterium GW2011_GWA2_45_13]|uniref:Ribosomal RNA small subunit methyltransferase I n=1 Tax=Candidatus Jorgensenbacteria bacterium GW2011_GWA2_45_13 TaxID=1618662 RepID=A0A0G1L4G5_9BACT|nr:MAG: methyltransferase [Candidatus Jorgensenbacteria bacterium GW2011_GWA2_45_13]
MGTFFIVATPIGNLKDITLRALEVLKDADIVLAEDTRVAKKLLQHYKIQKPVWRADAKEEREIVEKIVKELTSGKKIAFVSDAGTPNVSDPGAFLTRYVREYLPKCPVLAIPGPSALTAFLSVAGVSSDRFTFLGYPPHKKGRQTFFKTLTDIKTRPVVLYESPHRLQKTFEGIKDVLGGDVPIVVGKELTKIHEEIWKGSVESAKEYFSGEKGKGEFVILIE